MDKYRLVDEKFIGAEGFIDDDDEREAGDGEGEARARGVVRIVPTSRPRGCITVAMDLLVRVYIVNNLMLPIWEYQTQMHV